MSLRVVFDTNVIVSAMLTSDGVCAHLLLLAIDGLAIPVIDARILHEYERVLRRPKFKLAPEAVNGVLRFLEETAETHVALPLNITLPDASDLPFLEVAATANACLVTGNVRHFPESIIRGVFAPANPRGVLVLTPADALKLLADGTCTAVEVP